MHSSAKLKAKEIHAYDEVTQDALHIIALFDQLSMFSNAFHTNLY